MDVGISYVSNKYYAHLTVKNLLFSPHNMYGDFEYSYPRDRTSFKRFVASIGYVFYTESPWSFEPSALFQVSEPTKEKSIDTNFKSLLQDEIRKILGWLIFRNSLEGAEFVDVSTGQIKEQTLQLITPSLELIIEILFFHIITHINLVILILVLVVFIKLLLDLTY